MNLEKVINHFDAKSSLSYEYLPEYNPLYKFQNFSSLNYSHVPISHLSIFQKLCFDLIENKIH